MLVRNSSPRRCSVSAFLDVALDWRRTQGIGALGDRCLAIEWCRSCYGPWSKEPPLRMGNPTMAMPLPLWRHSRAEEAAEDVVPICFDLPWENGPVNTAVFCSVSTVRLALQRLSGSSGRPQTHWQPISGPVQQPERPWPRPRQKGYLSPLMEVLQPMAQIVGALALVLIGICICASAASSSDRKPRRPLRSATTIRQERSMNRKSRTTMQNVGRQKKLD